MVAPRTTLSDLDQLNPQELKALILRQQEEILSQRKQLVTKDEQLVSRDAEIEHLKLLIAKLRRRSHRDRQQHRRTFPACCRFRQKKLFIQWIRCWGQTRRGYLQPHQFSQTQRPEPGSLSAKRLGAHR